MIRAAVMVLAVSMLSGVAPARAATCDRACLEGIADRYLEALLAHDPSKAPLARGARYAENNVVLPLPDGLWRTVTGLGAYRLKVTDPTWQTVGFYAKVQENGAPVLLATFLKVEGGRITEIDAQVARLTDTTGSGTPANLREDKLGDAPRSQFLSELPVAARRSRAELAAIADSYYTGLENNRGTKVPPFADDCLRLENGTPTSGRPVPPGAQPNGMNHGCREAFGLGYYRDDTRLRNRRILAIDEARGLVYATVFFDHDASLRHYTLNDGREIEVRNTGPWTWSTQELFQVNADGKISQVEAVLMAVPYGQRPAFRTGQHFPSPQADRDGFKEY
ncbi:MAG: hypothetical protein RLZZ393_1896 [Pseudomonadota bacterium]|jgi:hypothetical protein